MEREGLTYEEALKRILASVSPLPCEAVAITNALGRYLAEPLAAQADSPAFDNSAVDGYGVRVADLAEATEAYPASLFLAGSVRAGETPSDELPVGSTIQILTGAPIPKGVEAVVMQEDVVVSDDVVYFSSQIAAHANIRRQAEEYSKGATLAEMGQFLTPPLVALAATAGHTQVAVHLTPSVVVISTGDELVTPGEPLQPGQIWESNSFGLMSALAALGVSATRIRAKDTPESVRTALDQAFQEADVVLTSGGVSVGEHDHVKSMSEEVGVRREFWGVKVKPGGPFYFGSLGDKKLFGLPGNPVSAMVTYFVFVKPALEKMMGAVSPNKTHGARLKCQLTAKGDRLEFVRGRLQQCEAEVWVEPIEARGSHMAGGLANADCLIHLPANVGTIEVGATLEVTPLRWSNL